MNKFKWLGVICFTIITLSTLVGCNTHKEIFVGKYYADDSNDSYIEIFKDKKAVFINTDLTLADLL